MADPDTEPAGAAEYVLPAIPISAGALIFDGAGRLLILNPTYKSGWTIPGGVMEADGETPWQACQREVLEETGLAVTGARLACVDFRPPRDGNQGGVRFLFDCGAVDDLVLSEITLQSEEVSEHLLAPVGQALEMLRGPIRRRVSAALDNRHGTVYLEDGQPIPAVTAG